MNMSPRWTGHSARVGWATHRLMAGQPFSEIQEQGQWKSPASLRIYLDVQAAAAADTFSDVQLMLPMAALIEEQFVNLWGYLPASSPVLRRVPRKR